MLYNAEQVKLMFEEHAILVYDQECVTIQDTFCLFGKDALDFAFHYGDHKVDFSDFGDSETSVYELFVSYQGFRLTATYANLLELRRMRKEREADVGPLPDVSLKPKAPKHRKSTTPKVIDIRTMFKDNAALAAQQKVR